MILDVLIEARHAGRLDLTRPDHPVFTYDAAYLRNRDATPLSTLFPPAAARPEGEPLLWWLQGLLPDHDGVLTSLCEEHDVPRAHEVLLLGTRVGEDCAGAVQFCDPARTSSLVAGVGSLHPLTDDEVFDWLRNLRADAAYRPDPHVAARSFSLAGMQPKLALRRTATGWAEPRGAEPSSHILKVTRHKEYPHEALMEHIALQTASRLGIPAPPSTVITDGDVEAIVVRRYDRRAVEGRLLRIHQEDLCQALGYPPGLKYQNKGGPAPGGIAATLRTVEIPGRTQMIDTFRDMLAFQWLIVGNDGHAKNYGLLLQGRGRYLAPLYDACSWMPYRSPGQKIRELRTAMKIGRNYRIGSADQATAMLHTADRLAVPAEVLAARFAELASLLPDAVDGAVGALPPAAANLPIVANYLIDQHHRAGRCAAIAAQGVAVARARAKRGNSKESAAKDKASSRRNPMQPPPACTYRALTKGGRACGKPLGAKGRCGVPGHE